MDTNKELKKHPLAYVESFILHPQFVVPIILFLPFLKEGLFREFLVTFLIIFVMPFFFFLYCYKTDRISDWDITRRKERFQIYGVGVIAFIFALAYMYYYTTPFIFNEYFKFFGLGVIVALVNFILKISVHVSALMTLCVILVEYFQVSVLVFMLVPLVAVSRILLKRHKLAEAIAGVLVPGFFYLFMKMI